MALIALAGFFVTRTFKFGKTEQQFMSKLLLYVVNPCLILRTFNVPFSSQGLKELLVVILMALGAHIVLTLIALIFCHSKKPEEKDFDSLDKLAVVFTNCGFIGIPLINGIFGSGGAFYLMGYLAVFNIYLWTFGYLMVTGKMNPVKIITNPNVIAVILGIIIYCLPFEIPSVIISPVSFIGDMNTATSMLLLGMLFANFKKPEGTFRVYEKHLIRVCFLRLLISGYIMILVCWGFFTLFSGMENIRLMSYVVLIASLCPVGMSVSSFAVVFGKDESYSGMLVAGTSALCIVTLPMCIALAEKFF